MATEIDLLKKQVSDMLLGLLVGFISVCFFCGAVTFFAVFGLIRGVIACFLKAKEIWQELIKD